MTVMHARAHEIVRLMASMPDGAEDGEILCDGMRCFLGCDQLHKRTVDELLRATAISESCSAGSSIYYRLTSTGRAIARRPELADEVHAAIMDRNGSFTIIDDKLVLLKDDVP